MTRYLFIDFLAALLLLTLAAGVLWLTGPREAARPERLIDNSVPSEPSPIVVPDPKDPAAPSSAERTLASDPEFSIGPLESPPAQTQAADPPPPETLDEVISLLQEAESEGGGEQDFISAARQAIEELSQPRSAYERTFRELRLVGGIDLTPGVSIEALERRRGILRRMANANEELSRRIARLPTRLVELLGESVPAEEVAEFVVSFERGANIQGLLAERARERAFCSDADELLSLLIAFPEGWRVVADGRVIFDEAAVQDRFDYLVRMLRAHLSDGR